MSKVQPALQDLYEEYNQMIRSTIYYIAGANELDDLVQDAFIKIWKGLPGFNRRAKLKTWIYRISVNTALDYLRKNKLVYSNELDMHAENDPELDTNIDHKNIIQRALKNLSQDHRTVLTLAYFDDLTVEEISKVLRISRGTIKSRLHYARENISKFLNSYGVKL